MRVQSVHRMAYSTYTPTHAHTHAHAHAHAHTTRHTTRHGCLVKLSQRDGDTVLNNPAHILVVAATSFLAVYQRRVQLPFWIEPSSANDTMWVNERGNTSGTLGAARTHQPASGWQHLLHVIRHVRETCRPRRELVLLELVADAHNHDAERPHRVGAEA